MHHRLRLMCNTLQHTAAHLHDTPTVNIFWVVAPSTATHCNTQQRTATHCNTLQHTATHCNTLQHTATHCNTLQHTAIHCNTLQHTTTHYNTLQHADMTHPQSISSDSWHPAPPPQPESPSGTSLHTWHALETLTASQIWEQHALEEGGGGECKCGSGRRYVCLK